MAFTKTPTQDSHNVQRLPASGDAFIVSNYLLEAQPTTCNYIDCFPLTEKQFHGEDRVTIQRREGWKYAAAASGTVTSSGTPGTAMVVAPDQANYTVFFTKSSDYYMFNYQTKVVSTVTTSTTASMAQGANGTDAIDSSNVRRICWLDQVSELKTFTQAGGGVTTTSLAALSLDGARGLVFIDGYLFAVDSTGTKIHNSGAANALTTWASTDFIDAEQYGDPVIWIDKHKNYLVAFGESSIEFFYNAGIEVGSPLARQESYSRKIGLFKTTTNGGRSTCRIGDDLYFLGISENDSVSLYRIRNFQVEDVGSQYVGGLINTVNAEPNVEFLGGVETVVVNNNPMVMINFSDYANYNVMYFPKEESWWMMRAGDPTLVDYPLDNYRFGRQFYSQTEGIPMFLGQLATNSTTLYYWLPDYEHTQTLTSTIYTPVWDSGNNRYKAVHRVDAVGDFGQNNTLTLKYIPGSTYLNATTCTPSRTPGVDEVGQPISFYKLGAHRRMAFVLQIAGYDHWVYEALEIEYDIGIS